MPRFPELRLPYFPPYDWDGVLQFLNLRRLKDVEHVQEGAYLRTVHLGRHTGWIRVRHPARGSFLIAEYAPSLRPALPELTRRLRDLFDLDARPRSIAGTLRRDRLLAPAIRACPGLRIPGAFDPFELSVRAVLGQQITVKAATTIGGRFAEAFGRALQTPFLELTQLTPLPERVARASVDEVASLGIVSARSRCLIALAGAFHSGALLLEPGSAPEAAINELVSLPGIGPWTAHYIAMRALRWSDAFPKEDIVIRNRLGGIGPKAAEARAEPWRPYRGYAVLHLWRMIPRTPGANRPVTSDSAA